MVEETANNNPIVNATKELALHVDKVGEKIQQLLVHEKSDDLKKERAVSKDGEKEVKKDQYNRRLQGAEVQLTRDAAIISRNSDKTLSKLIKATPGEGKEKLAGEGKQEKTISVLERLRQTTREFTEVAAAGFEEMSGVFRERIKQAFDNNAGLGNFMDAIKGDFSIMLGSLNALQQVPGFNILKTVLFTVAGILGNQIGKIFNFLMNNNKLTRKQEKKLAAAERKAEKSRFKKEGKLFRDKKTGKFVKDKDVPVADRMAFNRINRAKDIRAGGNTRRQRFQKSIMNFIKQARLFMSLAMIKVIAVLAVIVALGVLMVVMRDRIVDIWNRIGTWFGWEAKNQEDWNKIYGIDGIATEENFLGMNKGPEKFFNKDNLGKSEIDMDKIGEVSSKQLLALLREEGDDLRQEDKRLIDMELSRRIAAELALDKFNEENKIDSEGNYSGFELSDIMLQRDKFNRAQLEAFLASDALSEAFADGGINNYDGTFTRTGKPGTMTNYYNTAVNNNSSVIQYDASTRATTIKKDENTMNNVDNQ